ncbi:hypothetical protein H5410_035867 [Solanum commersonii]|uniref:Uncharacterized protein n=1 Tax=Solanum commersonii TaxID=4109 RepID=A0A9J5Y1X4_SOLCO|nr:hypothetical protein H5410_035867 [Solanum commersonii]
MIIKQIIVIEDWGISSMTEREFSLNKVTIKFTFWDYIQAFSKVLCYNNERHKHTWFIKVCAKIFVNPLPNCFLNWWSYHGPTIKIFPEPFLKLYREWTKIYFFIEFSIPWIHKWVPEVDFTEEQIPCLYRTYYNNFWDKLMKKDPQSKAIYGQELLDLISKTVQECKTIPHKGIMVDTSVRHMARKISNQDEEDQTEMINKYLEEVKKNLLSNIIHYAKSDSSIRSETKQTIRLLNKCDIDVYKNQYKFLHIGMVQIAFKPLTLKGLAIQNEFASDKWSQFKTWFFDTYSTKDLYNISQEFYETCALHNHIIFFVPWVIITYLPLFINVLERSYNDESGNIINAIYPPQAPFILPNNTGITFMAFQKFIKLMWLRSLDKKLDDLKTLIVQIKNDLKPSEKVSEQASTSKQPDVHIQRPPEIQDFVFKPLYDLEELLNKKLSEFGAKPMDLSETFVNELEEAFDYKEHVSLEVNKLCGYPKKNNTKYANRPSMQTYYYSRPTPQDVLIEERDWNQTNTSYSESEIYEWNLDGLTDRQLTILVHRMLMYATICKSVNNTDRTICKMIIAGFTSQLRGVDNLGFAIVKNREDAVYTLVLTILEHFNGRITNQYEIVRSLLNGLRCRHLGEFYWYKATCMSRVMELPENGLEH